MAGGLAVVRTVLDGTIERCHALGKEADRFERRSYPSPGARILIDLVRRTSETIRRSLIRLADDNELQSVLTPSQFALRVYRYAAFVPYLHFLLSFLQGAQVQDTPFMFVPALRRFLRRCLPESEVVCASQPVFNYSFQDLGPSIRDVYDSSGDEELKSLASAVPQKFIIITFPSVEASNALLNCMIGHEIGHGIYVREKLADRLYPLVKIDHSEIQALASALISQVKDQEKKQLPLFPSEVQIRQVLTTQLNAAIDGWLSELCSDALGLCLFGPAYYASFLYFVSSQSLDRIGTSHPRPRMRIKLLSQMMTAGNEMVTLGYLPHCDQGFVDMYEAWRAEASQHVKVVDPLYQIAEKAVGDVLEEITGVAIQTCGPLIYSLEAFRKTGALGQLLVKAIPPIERQQPSTGRWEAVDLVSILNTGWQVHLSSMREFCKSFGLDYDAQLAEAKDKLCSIILKSAELAETKTAWDEVANALARQRDSQAATG